VWLGARLLNEGAWSKLIDPSVLSFNNTLQIGAAQIVLAALIFIFSPSTAAPIPKQKK
jgi:hypothetical protein